MKETANTDTRRLSMNSIPFFSGPLKPALSLAVIAILVYVNTLGNDFAFDDFLVIKDNAFVNKGFAGIGDILTSTYHKGFNASSNDLYRPLTLIVFAVIRQLFGVEPFTYHLVNILSFAGCVVAFFLFVDRLFGRRAIIASFIAALFFALHPIHTEVVANCKSLDELLCFGLAFSSLLALDTYSATGRVGSLLAGVSCYFLSLLAKETSFTFSLLIPLFLFVYRDGDKRRNTTSSAGIALAAILALCARYAVSRGGVDTPVPLIDNPLAGVSADVRYATAMSILGSYLELLVVPFPLISDHTFNSIPFVSFLDPRVLLSIAAYMGLVVFGVRRFLRDKKNGYTFAIVFFLVTIALFSNIFFLVGAEMAERFLFFPSAGFCMVIGLLSDKAMTLPTSKNRILLPIICVMLAGCAFLVIKRNADWKDNLTLFRADVTTDPGNARLNFLLGNELTLSSSAMTEEAEKRRAFMDGVTYLRKAISIYPSYVAAHVELGRAFASVRRFDFAEQEEKQALILEPGNADAINVLGVSYVNSGKYGEAIALLRPLEIRTPNNSSIHYNLGSAYANTKVYGEALAEYKKVIAIAPGSNNYSSFDCVAELYRLEGKPDSEAMYRALKTQYMNR